ncbi:hypothetical protein GMLC_09570 [Geomonas limicola]|uniref:Uncharacterized protein n=1 Tax=Geomonas limicola TaxID=2740186 RepID=A0A6V8N4A6_9BACT|nr:hypothetical protein [Geomonas limicola]GFO67378.1 hypothetical protein GMLC_09570 [Geomonas limicola]
MSSRRAYKRFFLSALAILSLLALVVGSFNYFIDPMWCFKHAHRLNSVQIEINDRQQKSNYFKFRGGTYDTLMIGNSRVRMIGHQEFGPRTFNYALSGMIAKEYLPYIRYAKKLNGQDFRQLVLGLSFEAANAKIPYYSGEPPSYYIESVEDPYYLPSMLFNGGVFKRAVGNVRHSLRHDLTMYFDRDNVQRVNRNRVHFDEQLKVDLNNKFMHEGFQYLGEYRSILESIRKENPATKILVFTPPVSKQLFCSMVQRGQLPDYEKWLRDVVEVFGEVQHFDYLNSVTLDPRRYFLDGQHMYPETGTLVAHKILGIPDPALPQDFGILVTKSNLDATLKTIEATAQLCR